MIFIFLDDNSLDIEDLKNINREYESIDIKNSTFQLFNEEGRHLKPIFKNLQSEIYDLEISNNKDENLFKKMLLSVEFLNENNYFNSLEEIRSKYIL